MRRCLKRYMGSVAVIVALCMIWTQVAVAATPATSANPNVNIPTVPGIVNVAQAELGVKLRSFTQFTSTGIKFDKAGAFKAGLSMTEVQSVATMYDRLNAEMTKQGFDWSKLASERAKGEARLIQNGDVHSDATTSGSFWWWRISFTEWETQVLVKGMGLAAGAAGFYALIAALPGVTLPAAVVLAVAGGLLGLGALYIDFVDTLGRNNGVYVQGSATTMLYFWYN